MKKYLDEIIEIHTPQGDDPAWRSCRVCTEREGTCRTYTLARALQIELEAGQPPVLTGVVNPPERPWELAEEGSVWWIKQATTERKLALCTARGFKIAPGDYVPLDSPQLIDGEELLP